MNYKLQKKPEMTGNSKQPIQKRMNAIFKWFFTFEFFLYTAWYISTCCKNSQNIKNILYCFGYQMSNERHVLVIWQIWKPRSKLIFNNKSMVKKSKKEHVTIFFVFSLCSIWYSDTKKGKIWLLTLILIVPIMTQWWRLDNNFLP